MVTVNREFPHQKIIVLGTGALGSFLAAKLSAHYDVIAVGRSEHVTAIQQHGLTITGIINQKIEITAATQLPEITDHTLIFLTTKAQDTTAAIARIQKQLTQNTSIVCVQNGLGSEEIVKNMTHCRVVRALTYLGVEMIAPGKIRFVGEMPTYFGRDDQDIAEILRTVGLPIKIVGNIQNEVWKKLILNCVVNGLGSLLNVPNNQLNNAGLNNLKKNLVAECRAVAAHEHVQIQKKFAAEIDSFIEHSTNINSTLQDLRKHKKTEIEFLNGVIVRLGAKYGIPVPYNIMVYDVIHFLETR